MRLDDDYANGAYIDGAADYPDQWDEDADEFRQVEHALGRAKLNIAYGSHPREAMDIFYPGGRPKGLAVFVHGGYWLAFDRKSWSHFAEGLTLNDWAVAMPSYPLAPDANIPEITQSIAQAIEKAASLIAGPIVLTGHSAGGHLVARMATYGSGLSDAVADRLHNIVPISPVGDLRPLLETSMNRDLKLDAETAMAESPTLNKKTLKVPVHVWVGGDERPVFLKQARMLSDAWGAGLTIEKDRHHFDVIDGLQDADSPLIRAIDRF